MECKTCKQKTVIEKRFDFDIDKVELTEDTYQSSKCGSRRFVEWSKVWEGTVKISDIEIDEIFTGTFKLSDSGHSENSGISCKVKCNKPKYLRKEVWEEVKHHAEEYIEENHRKERMWWESMGDD